MEVKLLSTGISEANIAKNTRLCYGKFDDLTTQAQDIKTLKNLMKKEHLTPFELSSMTFKIKCPIYVQRQIMRHRTGTFLEKSLRYTKNNPEFGSEDINDWNILISEEYRTRLDSQKPEDARKALTLDTLTEFIFHIDLRNLMHFFTLRLSKHAQKETREVAKQMFIMFALCFPTISQVYIEKEAKIVKEAFNPQEMGEIWPMAQGQSGNGTTSNDTRDSRTDRSELSDDSLVSEKTTETKRKESAGTPVEGREYNVTYYGWSTITN